MRGSVPAVRVAFVATLLVATAVLAPLAAGDHVYSHRYVVRGRVVDADGDPVVGLAVAMGTTGFRSDGYCDGTSTRTGITDADGTFYYCVHTHTLRPGDTVRIRVAGEEFAEDADLELRRTTFLVTTDRVNGTERDPDANRTYVVTGRAWQDTRDGLLDGVRVTGVALTDLDVAVTLRNATNATLGTANVTTDGFGDYAVAFPLAPDAEPASVVVASANLTRTFDASAAFLFTRADLVWRGNGGHPDLEPLHTPDAPDGLVRFPDLVDGDDPTVQQAPGTGAPPFVGSGAFWFVLLALVGGACGAGAYVARRRELSARDDSREP